MPVLSNNTDKSQDAFATDFIRTLREKGYTGNPPNEFAMNFIRALDAKGFTVTPTGQGPKKGQRKTLRITWDDVYIGKMEEKLWEKKYTCLYRFATDRERTLVGYAPQGFDKDAFARQYGCDSKLLHVNRDYSGSYLWIQDEATGLHLMQDWARRIDEVFFPPRGSREPECIQKDLLTIMNDLSKSDIQRLAEVAVRLGQGKFRIDLEREFGNACAATRLAVLPVLRASHIVPWRNANDTEKLDPMNGLLLSANIDALFDRYMITFRTDGKLDVSKFITPTNLEKLGPMQDLQDTPCPERAEYLKKHNAEFARLEQKRLKCVKASA